MSPRNSRTSDLCGRGCSSLCGVICVSPFLNVFVLELLSIVEKTYTLSTENSVKNYNLSVSAGSNVIRATFIPVFLHFKGIVKYAEREPSAYTKVVVRRGFCRRPTTRFKLIRGGLSISYNFSQSLQRTMADEKLFFFVRYSIFRVQKRSEESRNANASKTNLDHTNQLFLRYTETFKTFLARTQVTIRREIVRMFGRAEFCNSKL